MYEIKKRKFSDNNILHEFINIFEFIAKLFMETAVKNSKKIDDCFNKYSTKEEKPIFTMSMYDINQLNNNDETIELLITYMGYSIIGIILSLLSFGFYIFTEIYLFIGILIIAPYVSKVIRYTTTVLAIITSITILLLLNEYFSTGDTTSLSTIFKTGFIEYCINSIKELL